MPGAQTFAPDAAWTARVLAAVQTDVAGRVQRVTWNAAHTNDIIELHFDDGRTLLVKRARHDWARAGFATSAAAAGLLSRASSIVAPQPLPLDDGADPAPLQAYWRIQLPTLAQLWPHLSARRRAAAVRSLGLLLRRLHAIVPPAFGPLRATVGASGTLAAALHHDLHERLLPAVYAHWTPGAWLLERVIAHVPRIAERRGDTTPSLVHGDVHIGNVLCTRSADHVRCVGLLDLDGVVGSAAECDLAGFDILHGPLFGQRLAARWHRLLRAACGAASDASVVAFFRCVHLANQGFTSGLLGHVEHAAVIGRALRRHVDHLELLLNAPGARPGAQPADLQALHA